MPSPGHSFSPFGLWPDLSVRWRSVRRDRKYLCVKVGAHASTPRFPSLLQLNKTNASVDGVATPNETIKLIQVTQVCRISNRDIGVVIERVHILILSIVDVKIFDGAPLIGNSLLELKWIYRICQKINQRLISLSLTIRYFVLRVQQSASGVPYGIRVLNEVEHAT